MKLKQENIKQFCMLGFQWSLVTVILFFPYLSPISGKLLPLYFSHLLCLVHEIITVTVVAAVVIVLTLPWQSKIYYEMSWY